jgi:hypothetical protein
MDANKLNQFIDHKKCCTPKAFRCKFLNLGGTDGNVDLMEYCPKVTDSSRQHARKATVSVKMDLKNTSNKVTNVIFFMQDERLYFAPYTKKSKDVTLHLNKQSCLASNYILVSGSTKEEGKMTYVICTYGGGARKSTSSSTRPETVKDTCAFKLVFSRDDQQGQWYMRKNDGQ